MELALAVYVPTLLLAFSQGMLDPTLPLYADQTFGVSASLVGLAVGSLGLGTMVADLPAGLVLERLGRRRMMLLGTAMVALSYVGLAQARVFPEVVAYRLVAGVGSAFWGISRLAFITDVIPIAMRGRSLSLFGGVQRIGMFVGPATGGLLGAWLGLESAFVGAAVFGGAALVMAALFVPETRSAAPAGRHARWQAMRGVLRHHWRDLLGAGTAQIFAQMIRSGRRLIVPYYGATVLGLDVGTVGLIVSVSAIIDVSLFWPAGMLMDRLGRKYASIPSFLVMGVGMALLPLTGGALSLLGATAVIGLGNGLGAGTMMTLGADLAPKEAAGEFLGLWRLMGDGGQVGGPLAVGGIADLTGLGPAALVLAGVGFLAAGTIYFFVEETLQPASPSRGGAAP